MPSPNREDLPRFVSPMLACSRAAPTGEQWAFEVKWDGARAQLRFDGRSLSLRTRQGRRCTDEFAEVGELAEALGGRRVIFDGELVCLGLDGKPDFAALRARLGQRDGGVRRCAPATLIIFDVLHLAGRAVRELPYRRRRELLSELALNGPAWRTPRHFLGGGEGEALVAATAEQGLEGVVVKRLDAPYAPGRRSGAWVKRKHRRRERFVVTGWRERDGELPEFLLARRRNGGLAPAGSASLGLDAARRGELLAALSAQELPAKRRRSSVRWAAPLVELSADVHGPADGPVRDAIICDISLRV